MKERSYSFTDKSKWPRGEWDSEPDKVQFMTAAGLPGLIVRGPSGALCGYAGVAEGHPFFGVGYSGCPEACGGERWPSEGESKCEHDRPIDAIEAHGGLTYADACQPGEGERGICHVPDAGEPDHVWWFGFDCAHSGDLCPSFEKFHQSGYDYYKGIAYVRLGVESLAAQLAAMATK